MTAGFEALREYLPARFSNTADLPWIPSATPGKSSRPLRFLAEDRGFVELLRMEPGVVMPLHRHTGEIHAYNLSGSRKLCTGEVIGPGDYVYEPPGNTDWWKIVGDETMVALVIVMGTVEFIGPGGIVRARATAGTQLAEYERHCREHDLPLHDLVDQ
jgi:quercetin dioxygenase-like cupin family protein